MTCRECDLGESDHVTGMFGNDNSRSRVGNGIRESDLGVCGQDLSRQCGSNAIRGIRVQEDLHGEHRQTERVLWSG